MQENSKTLPIGVFDSGMGGLTVLRQLKKMLPSESFLYLGDTARLPYGTKSPQTVIQYAKQMVDILISKGIKLLVIACNTATTAALDELRKAYPHLPMIGVIEPGAKAAICASKKKSILVLATETTVRSNIYKNKIQEAVADANVYQEPCGLFVALAEEGCIFDAVANAVIKKYLPGSLLTDRDCILLGCTHFPVFKTAIKNHVGNSISIIDSAIETAKVTTEKLNELQIGFTQDKPGVTYLVTDLPERFIRVGENFLKYRIEEKQVEVVDASYKGDN